MQGIKNFTALIELDLSDNNITALPAELGIKNFTALIELDLSDNNITAPQRSWDCLKLTCKC
ncbi:hypothetical protein Zm00014a_000255 [Zea mays]|uniref:Uncharacterized protein n=1 Tax=Zea mays TaxID=4577 RepID=A0A3L6E0N4_MAIZE|nr:hypothetical protein Zm00014a_000255 [Zea mays]